ncbi:hypothetical protein DFJ73DRAFT_417997 [Zopfochytrium polystomum]|nr:hypothetical protein DFJ73DRAFT_417997 [Zopfochytrium polystomum]
MCDTNNQNGDGGKPPAPAPLVSAAKTCVKCKTAEAEVVSRDAFCAPCFKETAYLRFRRSFLLGEKLPHGEGALIALSGGPSSRVLLHYMHRFNKQAAAKHKTRFSQLAVCYVDCSSLSGEPSRWVELETMVQSYGLELVVVPLESIFDDGAALFADESSAFSFRIEHTNLPPGDLLRRLFDSITSPTAATTLVTSFINRLTIRTAVKLNMRSVLWGHSASSLAASIVTKTSEGAGHSLPLDVALETVMVLGTAEVVCFRPLRDAMVSDIEAIMTHEGLSSVDVIPPFHGASSIQTLANTFVVNLLKDFPQTIHTVTKTAFKIETTASRDWSAVTKCPLCSGPVEPNALVWRSLHTVSNLPSNDSSNCETSKSGRNDCQGNNCEEGVCSSGFSTATAQRTTASILPDLAPLLCYACQHLPRDTVKSDLVLPTYVAAELGIRRKHPGAAKGETTLRDMIADYLLDDTEDEG